MPWARVSKTRGPTGHSFTRQFGGLKTIQKFEPYGQPRLEYFRSNRSRSGKPGDSTLRTVIGCGERSAAERRGSKECSRKKSLSRSFWENGGPKGDGQGMVCGVNRCSIYPAVDLSIYLSIWLSTHHVSTYLPMSYVLCTYVPMSHVPMYLCTYLPIYLTTYLPLYLLAYVPIYLCTYVPIYLSTSVPMYLSTYLPMYLRIFVPLYLCTFVPLYLCTYLRPI